MLREPEYKAAIIDKLEKEAEPLLAGWQDALARGAFEEAEEWYKNLNQNMAEIPTAVLSKLRASLSNPQLSYQVIVMAAQRGTSMRKEPAQVVRKLLGPALVSLGTAPQIELQRRHYYTLKAAGEPARREKALALAAFVGGYR